MLSDLLGTSHKCTGKEFLHISVEFQSFVGLFIEHLSLLEEIFYRNGDFIETFLRFFLYFQKKHRKLKTS